MQLMYWFSAHVTKACVGTVFRDQFFQQQAHSAFLVETLGVVCCNVTGMPDIPKTVSCSNIWTCVTLLSFQLACT